MWHGERRRWPHQGTRQSRLGADVSWRFGTDGLATDGRRRLGMDPRRSSFRAGRRCRSRPGSSRACLSLTGVGWRDRFSGRSGRRCLSLTAAGRRNRFRIRSGWWWRSRSGVDPRCHSRSGVGWRRSKFVAGLYGDRGAVTVEAAIAVSALVVVVALCLAGLGVIADQLRCTDAAREAARLIARGEPQLASRAVAEIAPAGARLDVDESGEVVRVRVRARPVGGMLPGLRVTGEAYAVSEPNAEPAVPAGSQVEQEPVGRTALSGNGPGLPKRKEPGDDFTAPM